MRPRVRLVSRCTSAGARRKCVFFLILFHCADERRELALERLLRDVFADRADDHAAGIGGQNALHLLAKPLAFGALADLAADADAARERHVDEEAAGERDLRGDARALRGDRLLGDLDEDLLPALQHILDRAAPSRDGRAMASSSSSSPSSSSSSSSSSPSSSNTRSDAWRKALFSVPMSTNAA